MWRHRKARTRHGPETGGGESFPIQQSETGICEDSDNGGCLEHASKPRRKGEKPPAWPRLSRGEPQFHRGRAWSLGAPRPLHVPRFSHAAQQSSLGSPDSVWEQRPARPDRGQASGSEKRGAAGSDGLVAAVQSPWTTFKTGSRANRRWPQGLGEWAVSGRGLSTQHTSQPLLCSGPSAHAWGTEMTNIQPLPGTLPPYKVTGNQSGMCRGHRTA